MALVIIIWVASAVLIRSIFKSDSTKFDKPLFLTYFSTSFFIVYLIPVVFDVIKARYNALKEQKMVIEHEKQEVDEEEVKLSANTNSCPESDNEYLATKDDIKGTVVIKTTV